MRRFALVALVMCLFALPAFAQTTTGSLNGTVSGPDGAIPGATITIVDNQTKREITVQSSGDGTFNVPQLEFGTYTVRVQAQGFKTFEATELKIDVGRTYTLNPVLEVGGVQETVTVVAGADTLNASNAELSNTVSPVQIQELPLDGRSPLSLIPLQAGAAQTPGGLTFINGQRTSFSNVTRDGINVQDNFIRANATDFSPERSSSDDTGEFTIVTQNAGAELGYGSAQVQLVTPRGQDEFNGALYIYNRNSRFAANDFTNNATGQPRPFLNRNQFGGKIGGPFPTPVFGEGGNAWEKGKGFFFFNYERQYLRQSFPFTGTVLNSTARNGIFSFTDSTGAVRQVNLFSLPTVGGAGPAGINPFIQNLIINPSPLPNGATGLNTGLFTIAQTFNTDYDYYTSRVDYDASDKHTINGVYTYKKEVLQRPDASTIRFSAVTPVVQPGINKFLALAWRWTPTGSFSNEVRGGFSFPEAIFDNTSEPLPAFIVSALVDEPFEQFLDQGRTQRNYNIQDNASYSFGNHSFRFGGVGQFFNINPFNFAGAVPIFNLAVSANTPQLTAQSFAGVLPPGATISAAQVTTANNLLALLGGIIGSGQQTFQPASQTGGFGIGPSIEDFSYENYGFYFADQWRVSPTLTLNLGLRYELTTPLRLGNGLLLEPIIGDRDPVEAVLDPNGGYQFIGGNAGGNNRFHRTDKDNFAPVISFAWSPQFQNKFLGSVFSTDGRTVVRGGLRVSYVQDQVLTSLRNAGRGNAGLGATTLAAVQNGTANLNLRAGVDPLPTINPPAPFTLPRTYAQNNGAAFSNFGTVFAVDPNLQQARTVEYNVGYQREIGFQTAVEIRYVGAMSNSLLRAVDLNQVQIFGNGFFEDFQRAAANLNQFGTAFCNPATQAGCQALQIFGTGANARIRIANNTANALAVATFNNNLLSGTPGQLAFNILTSNADFNTANGQFPLLPNPNTGVADLVLSDARFRYNSLQMEVRRRFAQGLYFQGNYTFQKTLTDAVGTSQALFDPRLNNAQPELEYSRADYDQTHVFNFNSIYELPFGRGKRFLNEGGAIDKIFGGFKINTIVRLGSGPPVTITDARGTLNRTARSTRQTPNTTLTKDEIKALFGNFVVNGQRFFFNPEALNITVNPNGTITSTVKESIFQTVPAGQTGNLERAFINGPKQFRMDAALVKDIQLTEGTRIQLRAEAFNLTNRVNFNYGQLLDISNTRFGQLDPDDTTGSYEARRLQFAFRFEF
jgi:hypothetical protein